MSTGRVPGIAKRRLRICLLLTLAVCMGALAAPARATSILFVGNSFTYERAGWRGASGDAFSPVDGN
jgi:hypothetical protein